MNHTLTLNSTGHAAARRDVLYSASCTCRQWSMRNVTAKTARAEHAAHLQVHLGPDAQNARERASMTACIDRGHFDGHRPSFRITLRAQVGPIVQRVLFPAAPIVELYEPAPCEHLEVGMAEKSLQ